jgi:hypothetical protein
MYHHQSRIIKLERWVRIIAWFYLVVVGLRILVLIYTGVSFYINPGYVDASNITGQNVYWFRAGVVFSNFSYLLGSLFFCLLFFGLSRTIRYLLALKETIGRPHRTLSPDRS